jgi:hypothetical protein
MPVISWRSSPGVAATANGSSPGASPSKAIQLLAAATPAGSVARYSDFPPPSTDG